MKHLTARFAWHDNKWNGKVCQNPSENIYCVDNYSLLSSRIQRRKNTAVEDKFKGESLSKIKENVDYIPPCYWCINALGESKFNVEDVHPFVDTWDKFKGVPPIKDTLKPFSIFTWNFNLSFSIPGEYKYPPDLEERVKRYIDEIKLHQTIVFLYANYSNPITGDDRKYLLLGAGLVREKIEFPKSYKFPQKLYDDANRDMPVFPKISWQFQVPLDPETTFILPYHEYLDWIEQDNGLERDGKEKYLDAISVRVDDSTIIPHFKYVSMHLPHDRAIYLLYKIKKSVNEMKKHGIIALEQINDIERKIEKLLNLAWEKRGECPGFRNLIGVLLKSDFKGAVLEDMIDDVESTIIKNFGNIKEFLKNEDNIEKLSVIGGKSKIMANAIKRRFELIEYLSRFDFSKKQFENIIDFIGEIGFNQFKSNPYVILERYPYDLKYDDWEIENNDYGISVYQLDIAFIPDSEYVDWEILYDSRSLERVRALITKILKDAAQNDGHTCLTREEILEEIKDYPLYYIQREFGIDKLLITGYEGEQRFKETYDVRNIEGQAIYQLKSLEEIEKIIESFINILKRKNYSVTSDKIEHLVKRDLDMFRNQFSNQTIKDFQKERFNLYKKVLQNGLSVISGIAGSGKTSAIINLLSEFKMQKKTPIFIFTPTGKASLVIRNRLKKLGLHRDKGIKISTIHWFIYGALFDIGKNLQWNLRKEIFELVNIASKIFDGQYEYITELKKKSRGWQFNPRVVIIDEASMVDELSFSLLFSLINPASVEHLIIVGDDRQLPPIGVGRPFIDLLYNLKNKGLPNNFQHLNINLRFPSSAKIDYMAELLCGEKEPLPDDVDDIISSSDATLELKYFKDLSDLREMLREILLDISSQGGNNNTLHELFKDIFEPLKEQFEYENLEKIQIITPKRVGKFGTIVINRKAVLENEGQRIFPGTKIICEENQYWRVKDKRMLALANGSIGYLMSNGYVKFADIDELLELYRGDMQAGIEIKKQTGNIKKELSNYQEGEIPFTPAYAVTVHKSQGSDFDHVIFILSEQTLFITRELLYTGFTRAKKKMYLMVHESLRDDLYNLILRSYRNSSTDQIHTLLFGHKFSPFRPYIIHLKGGNKLAVRSKIEYIIAKTLDDLGIEFEYEPKDFVSEYHIKPDFKIFSDEGVFYWEHLGLLHKEWYKERWFKKFEIYKKLGIVDVLITTNESEEFYGDIEAEIHKIIDNLNKGELKRTEGDYSKHHYVI